VSDGYQLIYDARVQAYQFSPILIVLFSPILILVCLTIGKWRMGSVPMRTKLFMWGAYVFYAAVVCHAYWDLIQHQSEISKLANVEVVEGRLTDGWAKTKSQSKTITLYQHFKVRGVEFLHENRHRGFADFMMPQWKAPSFPLIDGAHVRITYHGEGAEREIIRFEIAASDLPAD
jgi:hypothetical protein